MQSFEPKLLQVAAGVPAMMEPVPMVGRVSEAQLEQWIVAHPELAGESLLVLGSQLAEFAEDRDRLDVLAIDTEGELVVIELKVDDAFRLTDLQALAYAGAYASATPDQLAETLRTTLVERGDQGAVIEDAREAIVNFLDIESFDDWQPTQLVRTKLLAPGFPQRVLATVKWLGEVFSVPIEAIRVRLFQDEEQRQHVTFERLLPLPTQREFDLTVRAREIKRRQENRSRRPQVLRQLLEAGLLKDGDQLWLRRSTLPNELRPKYDPESSLFRVTLKAGDGRPRFLWRGSPNEEEQILAPSRVATQIFKRLTSEMSFRRHYPVHSHYATSPDGQSLGEFAEQHGVWLSEGDNGED
jgi:hypothetical protein